MTRFTAVEFRRVFRVSRECFDHLCQLLSTCPEMFVRGPQYGGRKRITLEKTVLIALRYFGHQENTRLISNIFDVSDFSVVESRNKVTSAILNNLMDRFISWPLDQVTKNDVKAKFKEKRGFPGVLGCIDGTHIQIMPPKDHPQSYVNRKGYHSLVLQAVCTNTMMFSSCYTGWPGSCHDARVLRNSDLWNEAPLACGQDHILGDGAYPLRPWLMTPYRDTGNLTREQRKYNFAHSSTRSIIERTFALLKGRFRRLHYVESRNIGTVNDIILACCTLHNISISDGDVAIDFMDPLNPVDQVIDVNLVGPDPAGVRKRDTIARNIQ